MQHLEKFVSAIQTNKPINAIKTAIIKLAYVNIAIAFLLFLITVFKVNSNPIYAQMYEIYCVAIALGMGYIVSEELTQDSQDHYKIITVLISALMGNIFFETEYITVYPIVVLLISVIVHYVMNFSDRLSIKSKIIPQAVSDYFNRIIPVLLILSLGIGLFLMLPSSLIIIADIFISLTEIVSSIYFILLITIIICSFWILGIHGVGVIGTLVRPFWLYMMIVNGYLVLNSLPAKYIGTEAFLQWAVWIGGSGCTMGLSILLLKFSRSKALKELGNDSIVSNLFNINENIIFGVPIVDNKYFRIPFFVAPIACAIIAYIAFSTGWVTVPSVVSPWVLPAPIGIFISTLGDFKSIILSILLIGISTLVYLPFFRKYDQELYELELLEKES